jgi:hypothetical protein
MALVSPGVEVTIIDQSQYLPAPTNSVPLVVFATAQDKANPNGTGIAQGTTAANAGKLFQVTSQRDLVTLYGTPFFYSTTDGTPIQGYELNEYGLLAAYSALGVSNRCYCVRADIDLSSLVGQTGRPTGAPDDGTFWLDTTTTQWGIYEWNATTQSFEVQEPLVITDPDNVVGGFPAGYLGDIGTYAVISAMNDAGSVQGPQSYAVPTAATAKQFFYKNEENTWVVLGSHAWRESVSTIIGTESNPTLTAGNTFSITIGSGANLSTAVITVPGLGSNTVSGVAAEINALDWDGLGARVNSAGRLEIFSSQPVTGYQLIITAGTGTVLGDMGVTAGTYYPPTILYGTSAEMPAWSAGQTFPRPTGSVWMKVGSAGNGMAPQVSTYNATAESWVSKNVSLAEDDSSAIVALDATGGQAIPANTVYAQYDWFGEYVNGPSYLWRRLATGPTVVTGTNTAPNFTSSSYTASIYVTVPNATGWSGPYTLSMTGSASYDAEDFITAWQAAGIPYTTAVIGSDGSIQITHTLGGAIRVNDIIAATGMSSGLMEEAGFIPGPPGDTSATLGVKYGEIVQGTFTATQDSTSGAGSGLQLTVVKGFYGYVISSIAAGGSGFSVGDTVTFLGTDLGGLSPSNDMTVVVTAVSSGSVTKATLVEGANLPAYSYEVMLSNWVAFEYTANEGAPTATPANFTNWFYSVVDEVDLMVNTSSGWKGYRNVNYDKNGFPLPSGANVTDPNGPIVSASEPTTQSDGTDLEYGDIWIDTSDLENYPIINRYQALKDANGSYTGDDGWVLVDKTDQTSSNGVVFADARWSTNQNTINPADDPIPTIKSLLTSNNLDVDAPSSALYPGGMMLFNTRRSGYNVKQWRNNYFNATAFPDETLPTIKSTWVSASGLQSNGAAYMGRKAQRAMVVQSLRSVIDTNTAIRDEDNFFNLMATPNYPECQPNMVVLNNDRGNTGYILGDTPMGLPEDATAIQAWATNAAGATSTGEEGCVTRDTYLGLFYPSGIALDLSGNEVAVPSSHMMLRTFLRNDTIAYPWLAAAGTRRGQIDNALNIGYLNRDTGEFVTTKTRIGIRDVLYINFINPLVFFTGNGLLNYGNKTSFNSQSALDRTNVARLVAYIRRQLTIAARPFVFEPNDALTRGQIAGVVESLMVDLVAKRGIYDYLVVCDESNNTPARIDRNELWIDVAVEPVKAAEFIYIPVRILNTGELSGA